MANPQSWNRYSYTGNNPVRYTDPTGHKRVEGCTELAGGCNTTQQTVDEDLKKENEFRQTTERNKCKAGNKLHCSYAENHPVETAAFVATGLVAGPLAEKLILGSGASTALEAGFWRLGLACIRSAVCRGLTGMAGGVGFKSVNTPYGPAYQNTSQQALDARTQVQNGANLYKLGKLGVSNGTESQFWALENPLANPNYASQYGVPPQNLGSDNAFLLVGQIKEATVFVTRNAPGFGSNVGGQLEVVVEHGGVQLLEYIMP